MRCDEAPPSGMRTAAVEKQKPGAPALAPDEHLDLGAVRLDRANLRVPAHRVGEPRRRRRSGAAKSRKRRLQMSFVHAAKIVLRKHVFSTVARSSPSSY